MNYTNCWFPSVCDRYPEGCSEKCKDFTTMLYLAQSSRVPESKWAPNKMIPKLDREAFVRLHTIKNGIYDWVMNGGNLLIHSSSAGNGKTSWSIKLLFSWFSTVRDCGKFNRGVFINVPLFLMQYKQSIGIPSKELHALIDTIMSCEVVVWDDIASTRYTDFEYSILLPLIDQRILAGKANIYTANDTIEGLLSKLGVRLHSRIVNSSEVVEFVNPDYRRTIAYGGATDTVQNS